MNVLRVVRILGRILLAIGAFELLVALWCIAPYDALSLRGLLAGGGAAIAAGLLARAIGNDEGELYRREGVLVVVSAWGLASIFGAIPYLVSGAIPGVADALFESTSGFTTTGASILQDVEAFPRALLMWRSLTQWLGGIGIVVLFVAPLSEIGPGVRILFDLEVPGPKAEVFHARVQTTALALLRIYLVLTGAQLAIMLVLGASFFDALTHTFSTISTGGFSPYANSVGALAAKLQVVILLFMLAAGVNFALYHAAFTRRTEVAIRDVELRVYLALCLVASLGIAVDLSLANASDPVWRNVLDASFQVVSIATTAGFSTANFAEWPGWAQATLVTLMFVGGCAGSTAGGAKIIRLIVGIRVALREARLVFSPNSVVAISVGKRIVPETSARAILVLLVLWGVAWAGGALLLSVGDTDIVTAATASIATLSNIGPGLSGVGPMESFAGFAAWQKIVMTLLMWLGRLEFFSVLALMLPRFWKP